MKLPFLSLVLIVGVAQSVSASNFATKVTDATFKLFHPNSTSTCFLLHSDEPDTPYYLVTTAHTLEKAKGETATLVLRKRKNEDAYERVDYKVAIRQDDKPLWVRHKTQDIAVLRLSHPVPVTISALPVSSLADDERLKAAGGHICSPLFVLTYPERFESNSAGFPVARQGIFSSPPSLPSHNHPTFLADFTTFSGDSGGPVFIATDDKQTPLIVGIVLGQYFHDEEIKSEYEDRHIRHPLGLGIVLHARYVRETINLDVTSQ